MAIKYSGKVAILTIAIFSILSGGTLSAQQNQTYRLPLNLPPSLSGNYGELRATHFHGGLDFRIGGVAGASVYAVKDGFVSRISVSPSGYGQAIYIKHPDGKT
ncbi:MAG TPA: M23 family peptidase, partial [Bacteroidales bacterium]|nr:M23 family peptidase [Bacteroidales bacterium]